MSEPQAPAPDPAASGTAGVDERRKKGPLSFLSGALTSGLLCVVALRVSKGLALYFALHPPTYSSRIAQSIATALKTLLVGMGFLATFSFGFIAVGLTLVFLRSLIPAAPAAAQPAIADAAAVESDQSP